MAKALTGERTELAVLVPTHKKDIAETKSLITRSNIVGRGIISNQASPFLALDFPFPPGITVITTCDTGVSKNRNMLLDSLDCEYGLFIDDDCILLPEYEAIVCDAFHRYPDADVIVFSRLSEDRVFGTVQLKDGRVRRFSQVSKMGAPGIAIKQSACSKFGVRFREYLGPPNYFYCGEDSCFLNDLLHAGAIIYTCSTPVFILRNSLGQSSYFTGYNGHFFEAVGAAHRLLHPISFPLYFFKRALYYVFRHRQHFCRALFYMFKGGSKIHAFLACSPKEKGG